MNAIASRSQIQLARPGLDLCPQMVLPLAELLRQLVCVIEQLTDDQYTQKPVGVIESSVGGHVRHCLDHVQSLLSAIQHGCLDYDRRERGTMVESSRQSAAEKIGAMIEQLDELPEAVVNQSILVCVRMTSDAVAGVEVASSVGRELAFVLSHTIHHNAIISAMVKTLGGWLPDHFGYAPATIRHMENATCAR